MLEDIERGSVVFYDRGKQLFLLAIDSTYHSMTDFGGRKSSRDVDIYATVIREVREESLGLLVVTREMLEKSPYVIHEKDVTFLVERSFDNMHELRESFSALRSVGLTAQGRKAKKSWLENEALTIIPRDEFIGILLRNTFYVSNEPLCPCLAVDPPDSSISVDGFIKVPSKSSRLAVKTANKKRRRELIYERVWTNLRSNISLIQRVL